MDVCPGAGDLGSSELRLCFLQKAVLMAQVI